MTVESGTGSRGCATLVALILQEYGNGQDHQLHAQAEGIKPETIVQRLADIIPRDPNEEALARGKAVVAG